MKIKRLLLVVAALGMLCIGAAQDLFNPAFSAHNAPPTHGFAITPADGAELATVTRAIWVGTTGDVVVIYKDDTVAVTLKNVPSGTGISGRIKQVKSTGTTATNIIGEW